MDAQRLSAGWLSDEMANALAAMCPPLQTSDVLHAAEELNAHATTPDVVVVDRLFRSDIDRVCLRNVITALRALYDLRS